MSTRPHLYICNCYLDTTEEVVKCPATYRYAFRNGKYCCQTNKDYNGGQLTESSMRCQYNAYRRCPGSKCKDYGGKHSIVYMNL